VRDVFGGNHRSSVVRVFVRSIRNYYSKRRKTEFPTYIYIFFFELTNSSTPLNFVLDTILYTCTYLPIIITFTLSRLKYARTKHIINNFRTTRALIVLYLRKREQVPRRECPTITFLDNGISRIPLRPTRFKLTVRSDL